MGTELEHIPLDMKQLFFNNMKLLGFDAPAMEAAHRIPFNKTMFDLPNRHGAEIVLHFLFERLNPTMCKEYFRDCWPVLDKKREQAFRKTCYTWLTNIAQEEQESRLPRINASLFMSPGGDKFYQLLFFFSGFVREKVMETELGCKAGERLRYPSLSSQNLQLGEVIAKDLACSSVRHRQAYINTAQLTLKANKTWSDTVDEYVREHRKLSKDIRELDFKIRTEEQKALEASVARGSPVKRHGHSDQLDPDFDPGTIKRAQRVQQVREMWKQLDEFERTESAEREIVESIVERTINKHRLDAADISIKVPDMLLRECGDEIRRRNVDNTYQGGKLNLVSVLQLWNLCLHLYLEKIHSVGVAKFDDDLQQLKSQLHVQQSYQQNAVTLRQQMAECIPELKSSIKELREKLDSALFQDQSPDSIRQTSLGLGLVEPSPQPNFSPGSAVTPAGGVGVMRSPHNVDTPAAADRIAEDVRAAVRKGPQEMFSELNLNLLDQEHRQDKSSLPRPSKSGSQVGSKPSSRRSSRPTSARSQTNQKSSRPTSARSTASSKGSKGSVTPRKVASHEQQSFVSTSSPRTLIGSLKLEQSFDNKENINNNAAAATELHLNMSGSSGPLSARSDGSRTLSARSDGSKTLSARSDSLSAGSARSTPRSAGSRVSQDVDGDESTKSGVPGRKTPTDLLVEEIMGEGKILSPFASGLEAFESNILLNRTPDQGDEEDEKEDEDRMTGYPYGGEDRTTGYQYGGEDMTTGYQYSREDRTTDHQYRDENPMTSYTNDEVEKDKSSSYPYNTDNQLTGYPNDEGDEDGDEQIEEILGPELEEEYDNANTSGISRHSSEPLIIINRSLKQSPVIPRQPLSPGGSSLQQSPRGWTLHQSPKDLPLLGQSPLVRQMEGEFGFKGPGQEELERSVEQNSPLHESPRRADDEDLEYRLSQESSPHLSEHSSPGAVYEHISAEEFTPPDSPHGAIIIDRSFQHTPITTEFGGVRSQTPVKLPSQEMTSMSPASRLSQSLMNPLPTDQSPVTKAMLAKLLSPDRLSQEIRQMYQEALSNTPVLVRRHTPGSSQLARGGSMEEDLEMPNMDPNSRCLSDQEAGARLKPADISWDLTDNLEDIQMPDFGLDNDDGDPDNDVDTNIDVHPDTNVEAERDIINLDGDNIEDIEIPEFDLDNDIDIHAERGSVKSEVEEDKDRDTEKAQGDTSLVNINSKDLEEFFSEKTPDLPKRTVRKMSDGEGTDGMAAIGGSPSGLDDGDLEDDIHTFSLEDEQPQLISFTP